MKKYLLLAIIGLVGASLQTMERDPRRMEQIRNQRAQFEQQERKLADFENFLKNEWLAMPTVYNKTPWMGFGGNVGLVLLADAAISKAKEWNIDLDTTKKIFADVILHIMIMQKYSVEEGSLEFAHYLEKEAVNQRVAISNFIDLIFPRYW